MGEVVLSSEELERSEADKQTRAESPSSLMAKSEAMVRWDRFLPRMMMRVLLVEADDSTRQIITALLRKCGYKVAAVADGLKAWELLKGRPHNVDLILTEVDLPAISGFALLTLIMEHEVCKNIPVIMMSSQDSINTVYKCMMRGAADYLVKPVRRNELSNLWQHVWRRKSSNANGPQDESVAQRKIDDASENDAASNHSNGNTACIHRNDDNIDKGSDSQSSCTKPEVEVESIHMEKMQECSQPVKAKSSPSDLRKQEDEGHINMGQKLHIHRVDSRGTAVSTFESVDAGTLLSKGQKSETMMGDANMSSEACEANDVVFSRSRDAIDLNGVVNDTPSCNYQNSMSSNGTSKFDYVPTLDLTLRSNSGGFDSHMLDKRHSLGHSNSSAFTRYINRPLQPINQTSASDFDQEKECRTQSEKQNIYDFGIVRSHNSDTQRNSLSTPKSVLTFATGQSNQSEVATYSPQQAAFPLPIPVKGIRINNPCPGYGSSVPPVFCSQSGSSSLVSPSSVAQLESSFLMNTFYQTTTKKSKPENTYDHCRNANIATQEHRWDSFEDPTTDQSASSSLCNGNASHFTNLGYGSACGSNSNADQVAMVMTGSENKNEESYFANHGNSHRSIQREVALNKFRMKRKDRCFEKKVRYESRKKLAEQRPRVKGQFVRQVQPEPPPAATEGGTV